MRIVALCALVLVAGGCGDDASTIGPDLSMPDLLPSFAGVRCRGLVCAQECCLMVGPKVTTTACVGFGAKCTGPVLGCDGPEDCSPFQFCCGTVTLTGGTSDGGVRTIPSATSQCTTCDFQYTQGPPTTVTTRLCHVDSDCVGLDPATRCCSSLALPELQFCAQPADGITCP